MKIKCYIKKITALALSLIVIAGLIPITAFADGTYTFPSHSQSGDNNSILRYSLTDENAGTITVTQSGNHPALYLSIDDGWYFDNWETYFNGNEDRPVLSDPVVKGSNPVSDEGKYTFFNVNQKQPFSNVPFLYIATATNFYGDHKVTAVLKPILTVNAGDGIEYQVSTNYPSYANLTENQVAVKYGDNATITYTVDNKYIITDVNANYGTKYSISGNSVAVSSIIKPATVNINTRLKQQEVHFDANGGNGTMDAQVFEHSTAQTLTPNSFAVDGYVIGGWNTKADGSDISYSDKQSVTFTPTNDGDVVTLYAQWNPKQYTVTYKADGETISTEMVNHGNDAPLFAVPAKEGFVGKWDSDGKNITANTTITAIYTANSYTVSFNTNGGVAIDPISVIFGENYGNLPTPAITGLSGGNKNWYLVDANGNVTETNIKNLTKVSVADNHTLFMKRSVLSPNVSIALTVPGGLSDGYQYYIPGASQRVLTATVANMNTDILNYTYQWYKDGAAIEGATARVLTLDGNVADSGTYKVEVTATLKDGTGIAVTTSSATGSKEHNVKILHASNTLSYDANGGEGGPQSSYTGGTSLNVSKDEPTREHYDFIAWNTKADGSGDSYKAKDAYTFTSDGGNGGCTVTLYAQWKAMEYTVTYKADGQNVSTEKVEYGKDATLPAVPHKDGYVGKWDSDGKNITADTEINAVYTINKYTITFMDENGVYKTLTVKHGEKVTMPDVPTKDGYTVKWDKELDTVTEDVTVKAVYTEISKTHTPSSPQTGDNSNMMLWIALLFISGGAVITLTVVDRKRKAVKR